MVQDAGFAYDNAGNIIAVTDQRMGERSQSFTLDALNRLVQAASPAYGTVSFTYDDNGNRKTRTTGGVTETYNYPSASNRLSGITGGAGGTRAFAYTDAGNMASDNRASAPDLGFSYNERGRISKLTRGGATRATYAYAADGARASKKVGGTTTHFLYDEAGRLLAEHNGATGAVIREYLYLEDGTPLAQVQGGIVYYLHSDQLGTPLQITNAAKTVVGDRVQQPFGETISTSGAVATPLRFPGQYFDTEDGNYYNYFRTYDSTLGRYIQSDPIGFDGGLNLYGYAAQNPTLNVDPLGAVCEPDPCPSLYRQITNIVSELKKRSSDLIQNKLGLPLFGTFSVYGHQLQFKAKQVYLRRLLDKAAANGCHNYDVDAWKWATEPTPSPTWR